MGRPVGTYKYTPEDVATAWDEYKYKADNNYAQEVSAGKAVRVHRPRIYTVVGFLAHLGLSRQAWSEYADLPVFADLVAAITDEIYARKHEALVNGEGSTGGLIFDFKCNHGWVDKQVVESKVELTSVEVVLKKADAITIAESEKDVNV